MVVYSRIWPPPSISPDPCGVITDPHEISFDFHSRWAVSAIQTLRRPQSLNIKQSALRSRIHPIHQLLDTDNRECSVRNQPEPFLSFYLHLFRDEQVLIRNISADSHAGLFVVGRRRQLLRLRWIRLFMSRTSSSLTVSDLSRAVLPFWTRTREWWEIDSTRAVLKTPTNPMILMQFIE